MYIKPRLYISANQTTRKADKMTPTTDEQVLISRIKNGDKEAFGQLYNAYKTIVYKTACLISGNTADGEDIMQETFIKAYTHCRDLRTDKTFKYWLFKILNRTAWEMLKKSKREQPDENAEKLADTQSTPIIENQLIQKEQSSDIFQAVMQLSYKHRMAVILYYYNEMSTKQIAQTLECSEGTVKSRLHTARAALKKLLNNSALGGKESL